MLQNSRQMKFPHTAEDICREILVSAEKFDQLGDLRIRQLIKLLAKLDPEIVLEGILLIFEQKHQPSVSFLSQEYAGRILSAINPESQKDVKHILGRLIKNWDTSVEQVPYWLQKNYDPQLLEATILECSITSNEKEKLDTLWWWWMKKNQQHSI